MFRADEAVQAIIVLGRARVGTQLELINFTIKYQPLPAEKIATIESAYEFAARAHEGQVRKSGEPYVEHPLQVACPPPPESALSCPLLEDTILGQRIIEDTAVAAAIADHIGNSRNIKHTVDETRLLRNIHNLHRLLPVLSGSVLPRLCLEGSAESYDLC
jgi:(p)ppGpp synthase/HD superfamily hydrolase